MKLEVFSRLANKLEGEQSPLANLFFFNVTCASLMDEYRTRNGVLSLRSGNDNARYIINEANKAFNRNDVGALKSILPSFSIDSIDRLTYLEDGGMSDRIIEPINIKKNADIIKFLLTRLGFDGTRKIVTALLMTQVKS